MEASEKLSQLNQRIVRQPKQEVKDSDIERGLYVLFAKDSMLEKGKPPFVRFSEMKKMKFKGDKAHGFLDKELTQPLRRKDCYVGREVYVSTIVVYCIQKCRLISIPISVLAWVSRNSSR